MTWPLDRDRRRVAVVLARTTDRSPGLAAFEAEVEGRGDLIVADRPGRLVPELWRDGLDAAADADLVAFSTTSMVPEPGWLDAMLAALDRSSAVGVGGAIAAGAGLGPVDRAVYLLRHLAYAPGRPLPKRPSGENALYRREALGRARSSWADGFWEAEVHRRLERDGATWATAPDAIVTSEGRARLATIAGQRLAHGRRFGAVRAAGSTRLGRSARALATPAVPAVLIGRAGRGMVAADWKAAPSLVVLASAWACGETIGSLFGSRARSGAD